jgi:hypothetical protein
VGWVLPVRNTRVAAAADLGVNPLAGFSITFWTELIGAPGTWASLVVIAYPDQYAPYPGLWFSPSGAFYVEAHTGASNQAVASSVLSGAYNQRMLVAACFTPSGVVMRFRGVGGFSLTETKTFLYGMGAFPSGAQLYVSDPW